MRRYDCLKISVASLMFPWLALNSLGAAPAYGGWQLAVTFTTTSPGGDLKFDPQHVHAVWVEDAAGAFVKTIGRWGVTEHRNLTEWAQADGTNIDGFTGATPKAYQQHTAIWNLTDRNGAEVPDGQYYLRFELTNHNAEQNQFHRATIVFLKDGVPKAQSYPSQGGYLDISLDYRFVPTRVPELTGKPAAYVTGQSARAGGQLIDAGGEDPNVYLYWGEYDGGTDARRWDYITDLGRCTAGPIHVDLADLDASSDYYYRLYAENSAGGRWTDRTESFVTHGAVGYYAGYRVQSGRARVRGTRLDIDILPVNDPGRAFALVGYGTGWQPDVENADVVMVRGYLLDADTVRIERVSPANSTWVSWQVIECLGQEFQVYRGSGSFGGDQGSVDAPLNGAPPQTSRQRNTGPALPEVRVNPVMCIAHVTADTSAANRTYYHEALLTAYVNTNTSVRIERAAWGHSAVSYNWVVVEFDPASVAGVQHGTVHFAGASEAAPAVRKIAPVNPSSSILLYQTRSTTNGLAYSAVAGRLASGNTVEFYQYTGTSGTRFVEYHVVDFGPSALARRGLADLSDDTGWLYVDCLLSPPVDASRAMVFHGQTCNGTGDFYPRPFSTAELTSDDTLRIERQFPGQQSHIEWQVLELPPATFFAMEPDIELVPDSLTFPPTATGAQTDLAFDIRNTGDADLQVHSLELVGLNKTGYSLVAPPSVPFTISPQSGRTVTVRFLPTLSRSYDYAKLAVGSNDSDEPVAELALGGVAAGYADAEEDSGQAGDGHLSLY